MALELCSRTASQPHQASHVRRADNYVLGRQDCRAATAGQTIVIEAIRELAGQAVDMLAGRDQLCTTAAWSHQTPVRHDIYARTYETLQERQTEPPDRPYRVRCTGGGCGSAARRVLVKQFKFHFHFHF